MRLYEIFAWKKRDEMKYFFSKTKFTVTSRESILRIYSASKKFISNDNRKKNQKSSIESLKINWSVQCQNTNRRRKKKTNRNKIVSFSFLLIRINDGLMYVCVCVCVTVFITGPPQIKTDTFWKLCCKLTVAIYFISRNVNIQMI